MRIDEISNIMCILWVCLNRPGHPNFLFSKLLEVVCRPEFAQDHESGLRSDQGQVVLCDFSKSRFRKSPYEFLNLYGRFCPYNPPYTTGKNQHPSFFSKMITFFQKSALVVPWGTAVELEPREPIFEKCSHLREKGGVLMLLKTTRHLGANPHYTILDIMSCRSTKFRYYCGLDREL
jgi:hypothetical protein